MARYASHPGNATGNGSAPTSGTRLRDERWSSAPLVERYRTLLMDLDGAVYWGETVLPAVPVALGDARRRGLSVRYLTNNASRAPHEVASLLCNRGVYAEHREITTSAQVAARLAAEQVPSGSPALIVGGAPLEDAVAQHGLRPVRWASDGPAIVVQGLAPEVGWSHLAEAAYAVAHGVPWIVCNMDIAVPREGGIAPGNGALVNVVRSVTGRDPIVAGKPYGPIFEDAMRGTEGPSLVVGDGLTTDIQGANQRGLDSLLVLTGVTSLPQLLTAASPHRPTFVAIDLAGLCERYAEVYRDGDDYVCAGWRTRIDGGEIALREPPDVSVTGLAAGVRALCRAAWDSADAHMRVTAVDAVDRWARIHSAAGSPLTR